MAELLIVKGKIREVCGEMSVSSDFAEALNDKVNDLVKKAVWRAKENGRRTVMGRDL